MKHNECMKENKIREENNPPEDLLKQFERFLKKKNHSANTICSYLTAVRHFYRLYSELSVPALRAYREALIIGYCPATANQRIHALNSYLHFLSVTHRDEYSCLESYRLTCIKTTRSSFQDTIISNEDCDLLQKKLKEEEQYFWYFIVRFLVTTGARVSELVQIKVEHLECGYLDIYSKGGKIRRLYITDSLCEEAKEWCQRRGVTSGFLFVTKSGRIVTSRGIQMQLKHFAARYGIDPNTVYPHSFRHRFAKNFLARFGDIALLADLLGHESIETTRIYLKKSSREQKELLDEIVTW